MPTLIKQLLLLLFIGSFHIGKAQDTLVGRVQFYKSRDTQNNLTASTTDATLYHLNTRQHSVLLTNDRDTTLLKTDTLGRFTIPKTYIASCRIIVNPKLDHLRADFTFTEGLNTAVPLLLRISDDGMAISIDATKAPEFYAHYNTQKAEQDFYAGKKRYLLGEGINYTKAFMNTLERHSKTFGFSIEYPTKMQGTLPEHRILYRYNQRMMALLGIKAW